MATQNSGCVAFCFSENIVCQTAAPIILFNPFPGYFNRLLGCIGEWCLFKAPPKPSHEQVHRRRELQFIFAVAIGVTMELLALPHAIKEAFRLEKEVATAKERAANLESTNLVLRSKLLDAEKELSRLNLLSAFHQLQTRIRSDDRNAFEEMLRIWRDPSDSRRTEAKALLEILPKEVEAVNILEYPVDWQGLGIDPNKAPLPAFIDAFRKLSPIFQTGVLTAIWSAPHLSKRDKIDVLMQVIKSTPSLRCLDHACRLLNQESKLGKSFLVWEEYRSWWSSHQADYK